MRALPQSSIRFSAVDKFLLEYETFQVHFYQLVRSRIFQNYCVEKRFHLLCYIKIYIFFLEN